MAMSESRMVADRVTESVIQEDLERRSKDVPPCWAERSGWQIVNIHFRLERSVASDLSNWIQQPAKIRMKRR